MDRGEGTREKQPSRMDAAVQSVTGSASVGIHFVSQMSE